MSIAVRLLYIFYVYILVDKLVHRSGTHVQVISETENLDGQGQVSFADMGIDWFLTM